MKKPRIFIVEDEIVIVRGIEHALKRLGYETAGFALARGAGPREDGGPEGRPGID
ncbi:MAG TPA: hypothetical protein PLM79_16160 [Syntrophobacteraceae bacterium]|nr:hypothetical protein [Syntrophobacteraceae bacterium]